MKAAILKILLDSNAPIKRQRMLTLLADRNIEATDRAMRNAVNELIEEGECIASSELGYQLIRTEYQMDAAVNYLKAKSKSIAIRGNTIIANWRRKHPQSELAFTFD